MVYVSSNGENNYNKVEFTINQYAGTEEDPIPLYKNTNSFMLQPSMSLTFQVKLEGAYDVIIEGFNIKAIDTDEITPDEDGVISGITKNTDEIFTVISTNEESREDITISCYALE